MNCAQLSHLVLTEIYGWEAKIDYTTYIDSNQQYQPFINLCDNTNVEAALKLLDDVPKTWFHLNKYAESDFQATLMDRDNQEHCCDGASTAGHAVVTCVLKARGII